MGRSRHGRGVSHRTFVSPSRVLAAQITFTRKSLAGQALDYHRPAHSNIRRMAGCPIRAPTFAFLAQPYSYQRRAPCQGFPSGAGAFPSARGATRLQRKANRRGQVPAPAAAAKDSLTFANVLPYAGTLVAPPGPEGPGPRPSTPESDLPADHLQLRPAHKRAGYRCTPPLSSHERFSSTENAASRADSVVAVVGRAPAHNGQGPESGCRPAR